MNPIRLIPHQRCESFSVSYPYYLPVGLVKVSLAPKRLIHHDDRSSIEFDLRIRHMLDEVAIVEAEPQICQMLHQVIPQGDALPIPYLSRVHVVLFNRKGRHRIVYGSQCVIEGFLIQNECVVDALKRVHYRCNVAWRSWLLLEGHTHLRSEIALVIVFALFPFDRRLLL